MAEILYRVAQVGINADDSDKNEAVVEACGARNSSTCWPSRVSRTPPGCGPASDQVPTGTQPNEGLATLGDLFQSVSVSATPGQLGSTAAR